MISATSLDTESIALIRDYANELMSCVLSFLIYLSLPCSPVPSSSPSSFPLLHSSPLCPTWTNSPRLNLWTTETSWMAKEKDRIFQREYEDTPLGYQNVSRS